MADDDAPAADEKPAPPTDDLVTTSHTLRTPGAGRLQQSADLATSVTATL